MLKKYLIQKGAKIANLYYGKSMTNADASCRPCRTPSTERRLVECGDGQADLLHEAHLNDLQERQKFSGAAGVDVERDRHQQGTADRAFLEKHIDADRFLDFVSTRSPVFKERPLPKSKKEAIDLMMENPNLIRRPILIRGSKVIFGFDKDAVRRSC